MQVAITGQRSCGVSPVWTRWTKLDRGLTGPGRRLSRGPRGSSVRRRLRCRFEMRGATWRDRGGSCGTERSLPARALVARAVGIAYNIGLGRQWLAQTHLGHHPCRTRIASNSAPASDGESASVTNRWSLIAAAGMIGGLDATRTPACESKASIL
jgi:hypothetical protein